MAGQFPRQDQNRPDPEDLQEAPETPGEVPDAEDVAEGTEPAGESAPTEDVGPDAQAGQGDDEEQPNVSPDEQKQYDTVVTAALHQIFDKNTVGVVLQKLQAGTKNISGTIGHTGAMILSSIKGSIENKGGQVPDDVLYAASFEVVGALCDLAISAKLMSAAQEKSVSEAAMYEGMRVWGDQMQKTGKIDPNTQAQAQADLDEAGIQRDAPAPEAGAPPAPPAGGIVNSAAPPPQGA